MDGIRSGKPHIVMYGSGSVYVKAIATVYADNAVKEYAFAILCELFGPSECRVCAQPIQTQTMRSNTHTHRQTSVSTEHIHTEQTNT